MSATGTGPAGSYRSSNEAGPPRRVCLLAQYAPDGRLAAHLLAHVAALARAGFRVRLAMSGADRVDDEDRARLAPLGATAMARPNAGLDFGAWRDLIEAGAADGADEVLLANDSVIGPFAPLAPILRDAAGFDCWGMVMSREGRPHLQSWFVWMTGAAFRHPATTRALSQDFASMGKAEIIVHGELGLGAAFEAAGFDVGARYVDRASRGPSAWIPANPMHFRWRALLADGTVPYLKAELLRDNPARVPGIDRLAETLARVCGDAPEYRAARDAALALRAGGAGAGREREPRPLLGWLAALALTGEGAGIAADGVRRGLARRRSRP